MIEKVPEKAISTRSLNLIIPSPSKNKKKFFGPNRRLKSLISPTRQDNYPRRRFLQEKKGITKSVHRRKANYYKKNWRVHRSGFEKIPTYNSTLVKFCRDYDRPVMDHYINNYVDHFQRIKSRRLNCLSSSAQRKLKKLVRRHRVLSLRGVRDNHSIHFKTKIKERREVIKKLKWTEYHRRRRKNCGSLYVKP